MAADTKSRPASSNYTMQMPFSPFNMAGVVSLQLVCRLSPGAHTSVVPRRGEGPGVGVICSFIHLEIPLLLLLFSLSVTDLKCNKHTEIFIFLER